MRTGEPRKTPRRGADVPSVEASERLASTGGPVHAVRRYSANGAFINKSTVDTAL